MPSTEVDQRSRVQTSTQHTDSHRSMQPFETDSAVSRASSTDSSARHTHRSVQRPLQSVRHLSSDRNDGSQLSPSPPQHLQEYEGNSSVSYDHNYKRTLPPHDGASSLPEHDEQRQSTDNDRQYNGHQLELPPNNYTMDHSDEQQPLQLGKEQDQDLTTTGTSAASSIGTSRAMPCRQRTDPSTIGLVLLDLIMATPCVCFLVFAVYVFAYDGKTATSETAKTLLRAAGVGPTILPIVFAAVVGRFLMALAAWRLERGVDVASVEYLIGSRTVFSAISTPIRLRFLHYVWPMLFVLWALSPLGSQASLRVISSEPFHSNTTTLVSYLDFSSPSTLPTGPYLAEQGPLINAAFLGALVSPLSSKSDIQDAYGNIRVPLLENAISNSSQPDSEGWYSTTDRDLSYASLVGLPVEGLGSDGTTFLRIKSSYLYSTCELSILDLNNTTASHEWGSFKINTCNNGLDGGFALKLPDGLSSLFGSRVTGPRQVILGSEGRGEAGEVATMATCNLTTTHVEARYRCNGRSCTAAGVRRSMMRPASASQLEIIPRNTRVPDEFCKTFVNLTEGWTSGVLTPVENYFISPGNPFLSGRPSPKPIIASVGQAVFSLRLAQLLNTYRTVVIAPYAVTGNFNSAIDDDVVTRTSGPAPRISNTTAQLQTTEAVLVCHKRWLAVLVASALAMSAAGIATAVLNLIRRGPEVFNGFTGMLRDNPYVRTDTGLSTEDGGDKARRLRRMRVLLGDVLPEETHGYIALAEQNNEQPVRRLRPGRNYT